MCVLGLRVELQLQVYCHGNIPGDCKHWLLGADCDEVVALSRVLCYHCVVSV